MKAYRPLALALNILLLGSMIVACGPVASPTTEVVAPTPTQQAAQPTPSEEAAAPKYGGVLIYATTKDWPSLDPQLEGTENRARITGLIYSNLVRFATDGSVVPDLAESWEMPDDRTYIFHLRHGVKFHNGRELVADDVVFTFARLMDEDLGSPGRTDFLIIDSVQAVDKYTVQITTAEPAGPFLSLLADKYAHIVPEEVVEEHGDLRTVAVGTGPFMVEEWTPSVELRLKRNPDYFVEGLPYLDGVNIMIVPDEASIVAGLRAGTIHLAEIEQPENVLALEAEENIEVLRGPSLNQFTVYMNRAIEPLGDWTVRQAISYAIDREAILQAVGGGLGTLTGPVPPGLGAYALDPSEYLPYVTRDTEKAKALLTQAGYPDGFEMELWTVAGWAPAELTAEVVAANLQEVGIKATIVPQETGVWMDGFVKKIYPATIDIGGAPDPDLCFYRFLHSEAKDYNNLQDSEIDALLDEGRTTVDPAQRKAIYDDLQIVLMQKAAMLWLYARDQIDAMQMNVKGWEQWPNSRPYGLEQVWLE